MRKQNLFEKILDWIFSKFDKRTKEEKEVEDNRTKIEMCHKAIQSKVCPHYCENCAWYTGYRGNKQENCFG